MECKAIEPPLSDDENIEIVYIDFDIETLTVTVLIDGDKIDISFDSPAGYRVLDEGDLLEFWPNCSSFNGWLYEIRSGGWLDQERNRKGFASSAKSDAKEYFIIGCNYCINVLAWEGPSVCQSIR
jgi:hypothetical protein